MDAAQHICRKQHSQSVPADHVPGFSHLPRHSQTTLGSTTVHTKFGERAFSDADFATWNALPADNIHTVADPVNFQKL